MAKSKKTIIPPSLKPRKTSKKTIPGATKVEEDTPKIETVSVPKLVENPPEEAKYELAVSSPTPSESFKTEKKRFTLWLDGTTYQAFKVHVAMRGGSASDYIESLIKKDLNL